MNTLATNIESLITHSHRLAPFFVMLTHLDELDRFRYVSSGVGRHGIPLLGWLAHFPSQPVYFVPFLPITVPVPPDHKDVTYSAQRFPKVLDNIQLGLDSPVYGVHE